MHYPSSGQPYCDPGNPDDLYVSVGGDRPEPVQKTSGASTEGASPDEGDQALAALGASIRRRTRVSHLSKDGERVAIPTDSEGLMRSPYNRRG